jgi:paraquat-inducible protein B
MLPPDGEPTYVRMRFDESLRGLEVDAPVEFLGIDIGRVVSINIDYDEKTQQFPIIVGAVIYGQRLGRAQTKLAARAAKHGSDADMSHTFGLLVEHGLRAEARSGNLLDRAAVDQPGLRAEGAEGRLQRCCPAAGDSDDERQLQPAAGAPRLDPCQGRCDSDRPHRRASR